MPSDRGSERSESDVAAAGSSVDPGMTPYQSLYRRYRPRRFSEIRGQPHLVSALHNAVRDDRVGHAYLFSGPRGTGKTTSARVLAKVLNCERPVDGEPCLECESCRAIEAGTSFDLHELDAASNNGVEAMRELISKAGLGTPGRTKVYILDEVHQLSPAASAALLKTLEEPPSHVVFVLATTDPHKVLPTIRSRTQHYELHLIPAAELEEHVRWVIKDAGLEVTEEQLAHVLRAGGGSARDTLSALDQVVAAGGVDDRLAPADDLLMALLDRDPGAVLASVHAAVSAGRDPRILGEALVSRLRDAFLASVGVPLDHLPEIDQARTAELTQRIDRPYLTRSLDVIGTALVEMRQAADPRITLETALVRLADVTADTSPAALLERIDRLERQLAAGGAAAPAAAGADAPASQAAPSAPPAPAGATGGAAADARRKLAERAANRPAVRPEPAPTHPPTPPVPAATAPSVALDADSLTGAWSSVIGGLTGLAKALFGPARVVEVADGTVVVALPNDAHRQKSEQFRPALESALATRVGGPAPVRLVVDGGPAETSAAEAGDDEQIDLDSLVDAPGVPVVRGADRLVEAFPGAELIEDDQ
jgi:DNA polymerase-3 subunit gamma/tau